MIEVVAPRRLIKSKIIDGYILCGGRWYAEHGERKQAATYIPKGASDEMINHSIDELLNFEKEHGLDFHPVKRG